MLAGRTDLSLEVPGGAIPHASTLQIKLYPGMFSQVVDGLEGMLRMPSGCFEQTSSSTYPNILVLRYLRDAKKSKPELEAKALRFLQAGWQRLVTYEVKGGGFSWFGSPPANGILTAYGLMEFFDMDKVMDIDEKVVARTRRWLLKRQKGDGSFKPDASFLHQESWGDIQKSTLLVSAYITWSLAYTRPDRGSLDRPLQRSISYLKEKVSAAKDPYELVYLANAMAEAAADRKSARAERRAARAAIDALAVQAVRKGKELHWETKLRTATYGSGESANIEVTALALRAIMRAGYRLDLVKPGLAWLVGAKSQWGHWHSTQATIQVLQALVASLSTSTEPTEGTVLVHVNGEQIEAVRYGMDDFDVVRFVDASKHLKEGANEIRLEPSGSLQAMYTATATAYLPWRDPRRPAKQAFEVDVAYDRTRLAKDDKVRVDVTVKSNLPGIAKMGIVDLGVPPGFTVIPDALEAAVEKGVLQRYPLAGRQIILVCQGGIYGVA